MRPWSVEECESYAKQLRNKTRANTAEHAAQAIEYLLGLVGRDWVGLTEEEYKNIRYGSDESGPYVSYGEYDEGYECGSEIEIYVDDFAKAIEAKLKEKNGG